MANSQKDIGKSKLRDNDRRQDSKSIESHRNMNGAQLNHTTFES
jgi:hypothetical protein